MSKLAKVQTERAILLTEGRSKAGFDGMRQRGYIGIHASVLCLHRLATLSALYNPNPLSTYLINSLAETEYIIRQPLQLVQKFRRDDDAL